MYCCIIKDLVDHKSMLIFLNKQKSQIIFILYINKQINAKD